MLRILCNEDDERKTRKKKASPKKKEVVPEKSSEKQIDIETKLIPVLESLKVMKVSGGSADISSLKKALQIVGDYIEMFDDSRLFWKHVLKHYWPNTDANWKQIQGIYVKIKGAS